MDLEQKKAAVLAELMQGETASDLAKKYDVNPMTIGKWRREARQKAESEDVEKLSQVEPEILSAVVSDIREKAENNPKITTKQLVRFERGLDLIEDTVSGLKQLDLKFQNTIMNLLTQADSMIHDDMKPSEWAVLVKGISELHTALYSKGSINNINIMQQNNSGNDEFRASFRN